MAKWTAEYINNLDDSAFLYIEKGGKKDKDKKTIPRSLRHLPYKNAEGKVDLPHVKNALTRINQVKLQDGELLDEKTQDKIKVLLEKILEKSKERTKMSEEEVQEEINETNLEFVDDDEIESEEIISDSDIVKDTVVKETIKQDIKPKEDGDINGLQDKENKEEVKINTENNELKLKASNTQQALNEALKLNDEMITTLNESKDEIESLKQLNNDLIKKVAEKESEVSQFQAMINEFVQEKKETRVNEVFDQYCTFFDISEDEKPNVRKMMSTMSEDMLEQTTKLFSQKRKPITMVAPLTKPSALLSQYSKPVEKRPDLTQMSAKERVDYMFEQFTKQNR